MIEAPDNDASYWRGRAEMAEAAYLTGKPVPVDVADLIHLFDEAVALLDGVARVPWDGQKASAWWDRKVAFRHQVLAYRSRISRRAEVTGGDRDG